MYVQFTNAFLAASQVLWLIFLRSGYLDIIVELLVLQIYCGDSNKVYSYSWLIKDLSIWKVFQVYIFAAWIQASAVKYMRSAVFWVVTQRVVVIYYGRFGFLNHKLGPIVCPETSVRSCHYSLRNKPKRRSSHTSLLYIGSIILYSKRTKHKLVTLSTGKVYLKLLLCSVKHHVIHVYRSVEGPVAQSV
jgi:hypothetical protein